jgi:hypothetical protein
MQVVEAVARDAVTPAFEAVREGLNLRVTNFFGDVRESSDGPQGFLVEYVPEAPEQDGRFTMVAPHFHLVRQFQVIVDGDAPTIGKHAVAPFDFHYTDPSTPYGPIDAGKGGIAFFTLRPRADTGAYYMPGSREDMSQHAGRNVVVPLAHHLDAPAGEPVDLIAPHADGLASFLLTLRPDETQAGPDPAGSGGQYHLIARGSVVHDGRELPPLSLIWVEADGERAALTAGPDGAAVVVLQFPVANRPAESGAGTRPSSTRA